MARTITWVPTGPARRTSSTTGSSEELIPASVPQALAMVSGLQWGRMEARESKPVLPLEDAAVEATLPCLLPIPAAMVRFQRLTGCRPGEVCSLRPGDIDRSGDIWAYRPESHKTEHHGRERVIFIGPKAQDILRPYLLRADEAYCFSPAESVRKWRTEQHERRRTPLSCGNRPGTNRKPRPRQEPGSHYINASYRRAIHRACDLAGIPRWSPNRLRHSAATEIRQRFGLEAAQVTLGHASANVTQIYAERDMELARKVAAEVG